MSYCALRSSVSFNGWIDLLLADQFVKASPEFLCILRRVYFSLPFLLHIDAQVGPMMKILVQVELLYIVKLI